MGEIIDLRKFNVSTKIAAWALRYLLDQRRHDVTMVRRGTQIWHIGWGGRSVVYNKSGRFELKSFRRFEYRIFENLREQDIGIRKTFAEFKRQASLNRKEIQNGR